MKAALLLVSIWVVGTAGESTGEVRCSVPVSPPNGQRFLFKSGSKVLYSCDPGYHLLGSRESYCAEDQWSSSTPTCVPIKGVPGIYRYDGTVPIYEYRTNLASPRQVQRSSQNVGRSCAISNGGCHDICDVRNGTVYCSCRDGYELKADKRTCRVDYCKENNCSHKCINTLRGPKCICNYGYLLESDRVTCSNVDHCHENNCSQKCINTANGAYCACNAGYLLQSDGTTCSDIDECSSEVMNKCQHICKNTEGGYVCSCRHGYRLSSQHRCFGCSRDTYLSENGISCNACPSNSFTEGDGKTSVDDCICSPGYVKDPTDNSSCIDINECDDGFDCSHQCINTPGGAYCACPIGYEIDSNGKNCTDVNECSVKNGGCQEQCENTEGSFRCACPKGYQMLDFFSCLDIDECADANNGGCDQKCVNFRGGHYCDCEVGYRIQIDQKTCEAINCPSVHVPENSRRIFCFTLQNGQRMKLNSTSPVFPLGAICKVVCHKGFKSSAPDRSKIQCRSDGIWNDVFPRCIAQQCKPLTPIENGKVHPSSCSSKSVDVLKRCTFTCNDGYQLIGKRSFICSNNQTWIPGIPPECKLSLVRPQIECPGDITVELPPSQSTASVHVPSPSTNVDESRLMVQPEWVQMNATTTFPTGITEVIFTAFGPKNGTVECSLTVSVLDTEPPQSKYCPDSITVNANSSYGEVVTWTEPTFTDNVKVSYVDQNLESGEMFSPGVHLITYTAVDEAVNMGTCKFSLTVIGPVCGYPEDPFHGSLLCNDWIYGRMCEVLCEKDYVLFPQEPSIFTCDDSGQWVPSTVVQDCTRYFSINNQTCPDGFEMQQEQTTSETICVECPRNYIWSSQTRMCLPGNQYARNDFQDSSDINGQLFKVQ